MATVKKDTRAILESVGNDARRLVAAIGDLQDRAGSFVLQRAEADRLVALISTGLARASETEGGK